MEKNTVAIELQALKNYVLANFEVDYGIINEFDGGRLTFYIDPHAKYEPERSMFVFTYSGVSMRYGSNPDVALEFESYTLYQSFEPNRWIKEIVRKVREEKQLLNTLYSANSLV